MSGGRGRERTRTRSGPPAPCCLRPTRTLRCEDLSHSHGSSTRWPTGSTTGWPRVLCARSCVSQPGCCRAHAEDEHSGRGRVGGGWCPGGERGAGGRRPWARWLRAPRRRPDVVSAVMTTRFATAVRTHGASSVSARALPLACAACGVERNPSAPRCTPTAPEIDHILPVKSGGTGTLGNVQRTYSPRNRRKSDRTNDRSPRPSPPRTFARGGEGGASAVLRRGWTPEGVGSGCPRGLRDRWLSSST